MKRTFLLVLLLALVGSVAYAVVIRRNSEKKVAIEKKEVKKKRSACGSYFY